MLENDGLIGRRPRDNTLGVELASGITLFEEHTMPPTPAAVVLLVQAEADSREIYAEFLRYQGFLPVPVSTARDGLRVAPEADVIVTGLLLPGDMDGIEFIARLKRDDRTKRIPVIVLTACAWKSDHERAEQAGCDVFLPKPCLPDDLLREVRRLLAQRTGPMESVRLTTEDRHSAQSTIADVAHVEDEVAQLFQQFRLDLEEMLDRSVPNGSLRLVVTHLMTRRTLAS